MKKTGKQVANTLINQQHIVIIKSRSKQIQSPISKIKSKMKSTIHKFLSKMNRRMSKNLKSIFVISTIIFLMTSCKKDMGKVQFKNRSVANRTYTIVWDGSVLTTLYPQTDSEEFDVAAGKHTLLFNYSNSGATACNESNPVIASDETRVFTCSY